MASNAVLEAPPVDQGTTQEQNKTSPQNDYGDNNEKLPQDLVAKLMGLAKKFCDEDKFSRRIEIQDSRRAHYFWRGMQHLYWDYREQGWAIQGPAGASIPVRQGYNDDSSVMYVTNIYQAFGLTLMAVLTQNVPGVRFEPADGDSPADIATAKAGERFKKIIEHENDAVKLLTQASFFAMVDGRIAAWTRWELDERTGVERETISIHGVLSVKVPITASCRSEMVYLQQSDEYHVAMMKEEYPDFADKIRGGAQGSGNDVYERTARISVKQGTAVLSQSGDTLTNLSTRQRTWMRPAAFTLLEKEDATTTQLKELFPHGCQVCIVSGVYVGSWDESMDDCWAIMHALPGDGQYRNAMLTSMLSVQERFNDIINIAQDVYEKTIPAAWADSKAVDRDGVFRQKSMPGARYPIVRAPGEPLASNFFFEPPSSVSPDMLQYAQDLMGTVSQFLTGAFPALFGGTMPDQKTASGYAMARDQAMGRLGLVWRMMKRWWSEINEQAVRCAAKNRQEDMSLAVPDAAGQIDKTSVRIEELQGKIFCYPDTDDNIPDNYTQRKATLMQLLPMADQNPLLAKILSSPDNFSEEQKLIGLTDFKIPGKDSTDKAKAAIAQLLESVPVPNPAWEQMEMQRKQLLARSQSGQVIPDAEMAQFQQQLQNTPEMLPSVPIDPVYDDNAVEFETVQAWINSQAGQTAKQATPEGFNNVRLYGIAQQTAGKQKIAQQIASMPPPPMHKAPPHAAPLAA